MFQQHHTMQTHPTQSPLPIWKLTSKRLYTYIAPPTTVFVSHREAPLLLSEICRISSSYLGVAELVCTSSFSTSSIVDIRRKYGDVEIRRTKTRKRHEEQLFEIISKSDTLGSLLWPQNQCNPWVEYFEVEHTIRKEAIEQKNKLGMCMHANS